jgi:hypothetical protein
VTNPGLRVLEKNVNGNFNLFLKPRNSRNFTNGFWEHRHSCLCLSLIGREDFLTAKAPRTPRKSFFVGREEDLNRR